MYVFSGPGGLGRKSWPAGAGRQQMKKKEKME
jgi:hypothetical protein